MGAMNDGMCWLCSTCTCGHGGRQAGTPCMRACVQAFVGHRILPVLRALAAAEGLAGELQLHYTQVRARAAPRPRAMPSAACMQEGAVPSHASPCCTDKPARSLLPLTRPYHGLSQWRAKPTSRSVCTGGVVWCIYVGRRRCCLAWRSRRCLSCLAPSPEPPKPGSPPAAMTATPRPPSWPRRCWAATCRPAAQRATTLAAPVLAWSAHA